MGETVNSDFRDWDFLYQKKKKKKKKKNKTMMWGTCRTRKGGNLLGGTGHDLERDGDESKKKGKGDIDGTLTADLKK